MPSFPCDEALFYYNRKESLSVSRSVTNPVVKSTQLVRNFMVSPQVRPKRMWRHIVQKGDTVVDATCGNGHDTLEMVKLVADESGRGCVYGMDIQNIALENTSLLLDALLNPNERKLVKLFHTCHSRMEDIVPNGTSVRLVAFNLGYLPGGDKALVTLSETTLQALEVASRILAPGGLISIIAYVGHPGGRKEFETVQAFASGLPVDDWVCTKFEMINRQMAPVLVILFRK
ncbi:putative rRNA methylase YtqB isoform X2 [Macadamia integrifolia]|uniref:putative rRNA methylase YtqB isoform X2 n=1 Tax=Macadamia integrifolia TaxID=60698 RepID=UPI001C4E8489|nr:putative rRNA methylase YtqB isoform X2 [Macadamia integrifolia]